MPSAAVASLIRIRIEAMTDIEVQERPRQLSFAKTSAAGQVVDLSALILTHSQPADDSPAPQSISIAVLAI
jgi:hypothetical protein